MKVLHVTNHLGQGGAEAILFGLISSTYPRIQHRVVSLHGDGDFGKSLREMGVAVDVLHMPRGRFRVAAFAKLRRIIKSYEPNVVQTRLYHSDLLGGFASFLAGRPPVVWGVHSTELGPMRSTWKTRIVRHACGRVFNWLPSRIVVDADATAALHVKFGYPSERISIVPNGVDLSQFRQDSEARQRLRGEWGADGGEILLGLVARWHPLKDHANLLRALGEVKAMPASRTFRCVLAGVGISSENAELSDLIRRNGLGDEVILLGPRQDIAAVMNAIDIHVLSSASESLPFVVIEAMACGTPCVLTDVGDAAGIVGEHGWVVPPSNSGALAQGISTAMASVASVGKTALGQPCRKRAVETFSVEAMARSYESIWRDVGRESVLT